MYVQPLHINVNKTTRATSADPFQQELASFTPFPKLPNEVKIMIWNVAAWNSIGKTVEVMAINRDAGRTSNEDADDEDYYRCWADMSKITHIVCVSRPPAILSASQYYLLQPCLTKLC